MAGDQVDTRSGDDRTAVVTGASSGIGLAAAVALARQGWRVVLVGRDTRRLAAAEQAVRAAGSDQCIGIRCDFAVLDEVRALGARLSQELPRIDVLANNAGGVFTADLTTVDGFERTMQVNHLAHFLLSHTLRENLRGGRIINTSSTAHTMGNLGPHSFPAAFAGPTGRGGGPTGRGRRSLVAAFGAYGSAKQANILFAAEAARRWPGIVSVSFHPGVVRTRFGRGSPLISVFYRLAPPPMLRSPASGARTLVWLATQSADQLTPGGYYADSKLRQPAPAARDPRTAGALWDASIRALGLDYPPE